MFVQAIGVSVPADMVFARLCVRVGRRRLTAHAVLTVPGTRMGMMPAASQHAMRDHRRARQEMNAAGKHANDTLESWSTDFRPLEYRLQSVYDGEYNKART
jgi:hypothetical protein